MLTLTGSSHQLVEFVDIWVRMQSVGGELPCCPKEYEDVMSQLMSSLSCWTRKGIHPIADADHALRDYCLSLLTQLNTCSNLVDGASSKAYNVENPPRGNIAQKGCPLLDQKLVSDIEKQLSDFVLEHRPNFALLFSALGYGILYLFAKMGRDVNDTRVLNCLHGWTALMMLLLFIRSYIPRPARVLTNMRASVSGAIFGLALLVFVVSVTI